MGDYVRRRNWIVTAGAVATVGVLLGTVGMITPASAAATGIEIKITGGGDAKGKVGDKPTVGFEVRNNTKQTLPINAVVVTVQVNGNAQLDPAEFPNDRCQMNGNRTAANCRPANPIESGKTVQGSFHVILTKAGNAQGTVSVKPGNSSDRFSVQVTGGASPTATTKSPTPRASRSQTAAPTEDLGDQTFAPPEAGNGAVPLAEDSPKTTKTSGGMSFGFWIGIFAIVAALGLVGSLFYFRRKDRGEPDTGMHPIVPAAAGYRPDGGGYQAPPATYGSPGGHQQDNYQPGGYQQGGYQQPDGYPPSGGQPGGYQSPPSGPTQVINPQMAPPPPNPPPSNDQTVMFRRPEDM